MKILERLKRLAAPSAHLAITLLTALGVGSVFAATPTPVALWDEDFSTLTRTTSNVTYTLDLNGNGLSADNSTITIGNGAGVLVDFGSELASGLTVLFKYSNLDLSLGTEQTMATRKKGSNADLNRTGVFLKSTGQASGVWQGGEYNANDYTSASTRGTVTSSQASGVMAFTYNNTEATMSGTRLYQLDLAAKKRTELYVWAGLGSKTESASQGVAIGGNRGTATSGGPATGMKITGVAVFSGNLNESEMIEYVLKVFPTYRIEENTTVSALNSQIAASSASEIVLSVANGVEIDVDAAFSATVPVTIASEGSITLSAASQPDASYFSAVDFSGVKGAVKRSWLTPGVVGYNFKSDSGANTAAALVSGGTWQSSVTSASGSTTAMYDDGLSTFSWTSGGTYSIKSGTFLNGYLDDGIPARITLSNIPYDAYDVVVYAATDTEGYGFSPVTVNGTSYTWDSGSGETVAGTSKWGASREAVAIYGTNALRIKSLSGPLTIQAGSNDSTNKSRGGIAAVQVMPTTASDIVLEDYTLTLDGTAATWTGGTWSRGDAADTAPSVADEVVIVATASTTLTMDADAVISRLVIRGTDDSQVTIVNGSGSLIVGSITVESGILKPNSTTTCQPIVVNDGGALDLGNASAGHKVNISGRGVLKDNQYTGAVFSSVAIGNTNAQLEGITLSGDATIRCDQNWGIIRSSYYAGTLDIGEYTLTKQGSASFWLCNTAVSGTGTIRLEGGNLTTIQTASSMNDSTLELSDGATLNVNGANLTVKTLTCQGGSYIQVASGKSLNFTTISLDGTVSYKGPISASSQSINIPSDVTFKWVDTSWTSGDYFTGTGTLELMADSAGLDHTVAGATFGGTVKLSNDSDGKQNNLKASETGAMFSNRPELIVNASSVHLGPNWNNNLEHPIQVRNLSGSGQLRAQWTSGTHNYQIETLQERNTAFTGTLGCDESSGNRYINFSVIGDNSGDIHSLTITQSLNGSDNGGCKASTLTVADNAKVVFTSGGKWGYGQIVVNSDGWLESTNATSISRTLTLNSGSHVALVPDTPITAGTVTIPDNSTVYFDVSEFGIAAGGTANIVTASTSLSVGNNVTLAATSGHYTISVNGNNIQATNDVCTWADGVWSDDASDYENVRVTVAAAGSTLTLDKNYSFDSITLSGSSGALTIDGNGHTLTVDDIVIPNGVTLIASSALTVTGDIVCRGDLVVPAGVTFVNPSSSKWYFYNSQNDSGRITVEDSGEFIINGWVEFKNSYQVFYTGLMIEDGGTVRVNSTGTLRNFDTNFCKFAIEGTLDVQGSGTMYNFGQFDIESTGKVYVSATADVVVEAYDINNAGALTLGFIRKLNVNEPQTPHYIVNVQDGQVVFAATDAYIGQTVSDMTTIIGGSSTPALTFDVSNLSSLPTGTSAITLLTTSAIEPSLTGCSSDYYVKQDGTTGAVTLQLHAARASTGEYYDSLQEMYVAMNLYQKVLTVLDGQGATYATTLAEYDAVYNDTTKELFLAAAQIGAEKYPSLSAAIAAATDGQTVALLKTNAEAAVPLNDKSIIFNENGKSFAGTLTGNGSIIVSAAPSTTTWTSARFAEGWTGEFVIDWDQSGTTASGGQNAVVLDKYGISGSTVVINRATDNVYLSNGATSAGPANIQPAVYLKANLGLRNGWAKSGDNYNMTTFAQLGSDEGVTFTTRQGAGHQTYFTINNLKDFAGTIAVSSKCTLTIGQLTVATAPVADNCLVKATVASEGEMDGLNDVLVKVGESEAVNMPIVYSTVPQSGLYLAVASANGTNYKSVSEAVEAAGENGTVTILVDADTVTVAPGQTVVVADGVTVGTISWGAEYATETNVTGDGTTVYAHGAAVAATYYWTGATGSAWATVGNWAVGASDGPVATRAVGSNDSVVFNDGATVTLDANKTVAGIAINGSVSISGTQVSLNTSGNITGTGTLTLDDICLASVGAELTVSPKINFTNDSELARVTSGKFILNGDITASGTFKSWDVEHTVNGNLSIASGVNMAIGGGLVVNGTTTVNGNFEKSQGGTLTLGNVVVAENTSVTVGSGSVALTGTVSIGEGKTFSIPASGVTYSGATFAGSGTVSFAATPSSALTFGDWTGTVVLPAFTKDRIKFDDYGKSGSTVVIGGAVSGWLNWTAAGNPNESRHQATLDVQGSVSVTDFSDYRYVFDHVKGSGAMTFASGVPRSLTISKLEKSSGSDGVTLTNNSSTSITVTKLVLAVAPAAGDKVLSTTTADKVTVSSVYVGDTQQDVILEKKADGIYVAATVSTETVGEETVKVLDTGANTSVDATGISGKVAIPGTVTQITGVSSANLLLKVTYNDGTAQTKYYGILAVDGSGNVSLNGNATVTVNDTVVKVEPELRETGPITVAAATSAPTLTVKTIPGLWYGLKSCATANGTYTAEDSKPATGATVSLTAGEVTTVKYYKVVVGTTAADVQ